MCSSDLPVIGAVATSRSHAASPSMLAALDDAMRVLAQRGARRAEVTWPRIFDGLFDAHRTVQLFETARALGPEYAYRRAQLSQRLVELINQNRSTLVFVNTRRLAERIAHHLRVA